MSETIEGLKDRVRAEAARVPFPVDTAVYEKADKDPGVPILFGGSLDAPVCVFARDLGKDEVAAGQPLIGAGGRLVRAGIYQAEHGSPPPKSDKRLESVLGRVLLTNTVPFKPPGNKAYATSVKERFRPFLAELLAKHWRGGDRIITLGTEAFRWFEPYAASPTDFDAFWAREDRYEAEIECTVRVGEGPKGATKRVTIMPLPHPSPLNARWYARFPALLDARLAAVGRIRNS